MKYMFVMVAVGLGAVCLAARAQSSVTLYGLLDVGIEYKNHVPSSNKGPQSSLVQMQSGNLLGNRWGLKGVEDLGGGVNAIFDIENGFTLNNGLASQAGREFGRNAYVGVTSKWGTFTLGRQTNFAYDYLSSYDISSQSIYSALTYDSFLLGRMDNSAKYKVSIAGLTFGTMYSTGYDSTIANGAQVSGASKVGREYELLLNYGTTSSPFSAGVVFDQTQGTSIATQSAALQRIVAGAAYNFGKATMFAGFRWLNGQRQASASSSHLFWTGLTFDVTPAFFVSAGAYHLQTRNTHNGPSSGVLYADYFLSKATDLYALASRVWNPVGSVVGLDGAGANTASGASQTGAIIGIRHRF